ncbi:hypothetical protein IF650_13040 [Cellulosimicrobium terreum]|nr:hypothetical protein [Cellulosimicrobium terreum]
MTWARLFELWSLVECDLHDHGVDVDDDALMGSRSWRWLRVRILGLLAANTRTARALAPPKRKR